MIGCLSKVLYARNHVNRSDKATPFNLKRRNISRKKRYCNKHGLSHFPPTGKKCPGPEFCDISLSGEIKDATGQQGGIDVDVDLLQGSIPSIPKKHLAADHLAPAVDESLSECVMAVEEALEENSERLDQILELLKEGKETNLPCVNPAADDTPMKPERASRTKAKNKKRDPSPSLSSSSDESTCSTSPEKERKKKDPAKRYARKTFLEGDDKVKTGDDLLLVGVKTVEKIIQEGGNPLPCVKHLRMLTEKVAKNVYKVDSLCKYDAAVRKRAGLEGVEEFGNIKHDEMFTYFTYDNTVKATGIQAGENKNGKFKSRAKKYNDIIHLNKDKVDPLTGPFLSLCVVRPVSIRKPRHLTPKKIMLLGTKVHIIVIVTSHLQN